MGFIVQIISLFVKRNVFLLNYFFCNLVFLFRRNAKKCLPEKKESSVSLEGSVGHGRAFFKKRPFQPSFQGLFHMIFSECGFKATLPGWRSTDWQLCV